MSITKEEVQHIADLARLGISEEEKNKMGVDLSKILDYVKKLQEVDVTDIEPTAHAVGIKNVFRDDEIKACSKETRDLLLANAPEKEGDLLKVKAVFE